MSSSKSIIILCIVLFAVLFVTFLFPQLVGFEALPGVFQILFRVFIFIALISVLIYLILEVRHWQARCELAEKTAESRKGQAAKGEEFTGGYGLKLKIDPDHNYKEITHQILTLAQSALTARSVFLYLYNQNEQSYTLQDYLSQTGIELQPRLASAGKIFGNLHQTVQPRIFKDSEFEPTDLLYYIEPPKVGSLMTLPILLSNEVFLGVLGVDTPGKDVWGSEDLDLGRSFTELYAASVWQIDAIDQQRTHIQFFRDLCHLNTELSIGIDPLDLYKEAGQMLRRFFSYDKLTFAILRNEEDNEVCLEYVEGAETDYSIGFRVQCKEGLWAKIIREGQPVIVGDYEKEGLSFRFQPGDLNILPFRACIGLPFEVGRKRMGGVILESYRPGNYLTEELETLGLFAKNMSEILNRITIYHSMKELAMIDGLTNIYNHRAFKERLQVEIDRARRYKTSLTLLITDLDKFKRINDTYGHLFGDLVLKKSANIIRGSVRTVDTVARYGGEEFAVILINADKNGCQRTADRIRSNIASFIFEKDGYSERMTISIGMAEFPNDASDMQSLISAADMSMYHSKRLGGNKITMFKPDFDS